MNDALVLATQDSMAQRAGSSIGGKFGKRLTRLRPAAITPNAARALGAEYLVCRLGRAQIDRQGS
jgi:hypothetical protein